MKNNFTKLIILFFMIGFSNVTIGQTLDLSDFELQCHYELSADGVDMTGNYGPIALVNPIFELDAIYSPGCYATTVHDSCLLQTPQITAMNDQAFAIQADFRLSSFNDPIFVAGRIGRYLGIETNSDGSVFLRTGSLAGGVTDIDDYFFNLDEWYNVTLIHNTLDSVTQVYINEELIFSLEKSLDHEENDNIISNTNFGTGRVLDGHIKNLKVYSNNVPSSTASGLDFENQQLEVYPNPCDAIINLDLPILPNMNYLIFDNSGRCVQKDQLKSKSIDIATLQIGLYMMDLYEEGGLVGRTKFVKK